MADQEIKTLIAQGLQALRAGGEVAKKATAEQWAQRIGRAIEEAGSAEDTGNPILEAHYDVSNRIRQKAPDDTSRDLGTVAAGQLALHYWIAAFGTLGNYASRLGLERVRQSMHSSLEEARQADREHTVLAETLLNA